MAEENTTKEINDGSKSELSDLLDGRCVKCRFWEGDRELALKYFEETENKKGFLDPEDTWCGNGVCHRLKFAWRHVIGFEPEGIFGCVFFESI